MREQFTIKTGIVDYDSDIEDLNLFYAKQKFAFGMMLVGCILILVAVL